MSRLSALQARYDGPIPADEKRAAIAADALENRFTSFRRSMRDIANLTEDDCTMAGLSAGDWEKFQKDPFLWFATADSYQAMGVYDLVERRQTRGAA